LATPALQSARTARGRRKRTGRVQPEPIGPNQEQFEFWDGEVGEIWIKYRALLDDQLEPFSRLLFRNAGVQPGHTVVDVGCGCGTDTLTAARLAAPDGRVLGLDVSKPMLAHAVKRAGTMALHNAEFLHADAQIHSFDPASVDRIISRFGIMFFADPTAAFSNLAAALAEDGRLTFLTWQSVDKNPWMMLPIVEALQLIELDAPLDPHGPGPFTFADPNRLYRILRDAGFARIQIHPYEPELNVASGRTLDDAVEFVMEFVPMRRALARATPDEREAVREAIRGAIGPYKREGGVVMPSAAWIVNADKS
jgi:SAM-dependent methyltransferase